MNQLTKAKLAKFALWACCFIATSTLSLFGNAQDCGFTASAGEYSSWPNSYQAWVNLQNNTSSTATKFSVLLDLEGAMLKRSFLVDSQTTEDGYLITSPQWLEWQTIPSGGYYQFQFIATGENQGITPYIISVDDQPCDLSPPDIALSANENFFSSSGDLNLSASVSDNTAVLKVVFEKNGEIIGVDDAAPFSIDVNVNPSLNGRQNFKATAYDPSGNSASAETSVFVAIGNKFFGTAVDRDVEYESVLEHFNQVTPGNAGKWGSVEKVRDEMNWARLDKLYNFAQEHQLPFKMHTLIWGQQQPAWVTELPLDEQLGEIEEWMAAVAARYTKIDMIDVVNEPLHAQPAYREALGGAGETGWDWLIKAFELARHYFPNSELILNDYNILIFGQFTGDYLELINLLQERGLIDGIGLQAHFLERAVMEDVGANLNRLAATGLPIYISELDINFAHDARQAQRFSELVKLFWEHPSVVGVTHWGYLEGAVWRDESYLITLDGEQRPAMIWLKCYLAGNTNCPLPEYIPAPRKGDVAGITIEAEDYDQGEGVLALGGQIAYVDQGDTTRYQRVQFNPNWDTFSIAYSKGNQDLGSVNVYLDTVDDTPEASVQLPNTGGWGQTATIDIPWLPVEGEHDVILVFADVYGVGNVDNIAFTALNGPGQNLIPNGHFEDDAAGWFTWDGNLSTSNFALTGASSLLLSGRSGNGPAAINLSSLVSRGDRYTLSLWTSIANASEAEINITQKVSCDGESDAYTWLVNPTLVSEGDWVNLSAEITVPDCQLNELMVYAEGPAAGIDLYLDHVTLRTLEAVNILPNGTFENGIAGWFTWNGLLSASTKRARSGSQSLLHSERGNSSAPVATNLTALVTPGKRYDFSFWTSIEGAAEAQINLTQKVQCKGENASYAWLVSPVSVTEGEWQELAGSLLVPNCELSELLLYIEGPEAGVNVYLDDVKVAEPIDKNILSNGNFEEDTTSGWLTWDGMLTIAKDFAHSGNQSLLLSGRTGNGPAAVSITSLVTPATEYDVSFWVSISGAEEANVNLTQKIQCAGGNASYAWLASPLAIKEGEWTQLSATLSVPDCEVADLLVYAEGPAGGINLYVDDVNISPK